MRSQLRLDQNAEAYLVELIYLAHTMQQAIVQLLATICQLARVLSKKPKILDALA